MDETEDQNHGSSQDYTEDLDGIARLNINQVSTNTLPNAKQIDMNQNTPLAENVEQVGKPNDKSEPVNEVSGLEQSIHDNVETVDNEKQAVKTLTEQASCSRVTTKAKGNYVNTAKQGDPNNPFNNIRDKSRSNEMERDRELEIEPITHCVSNDTDVLNNPRKRNRQSQDSSDNLEQKIVEASDKTKKQNG
jgi:hypothetical protein